MTPISANWSDTRIATPNRGVTSNYLGDFTLGQSSTLNLTGIGSHTALALEFDLYLFSTWDGNNTTFGPDFFSLSGDVNGSWTFTNHQPQGQSYPGSPDLIPFGSGADATHVYLGLDPTGTGDDFQISHTASTFSVTFGGPTDQIDEWWGIDNVRVSIDGGTTVPEPTTVALLGIGLAGLAGAEVRRRRKKKTINS
ncbi:endoglucanase [Candidatus Scalindua japonica]|uniref:Endoglucanase n=1 Tax=Candidatus Scalindua japonica TaxID=1284222 RepID=A0A286TXE3_9BACT|nr:PEP-CTERM sorting domain-containing protein [Candidatus Scalindua japonica]GAX60558.1 endoglucanase [Candidatus Scalindua japonica]